MSPNKSDYSPLNIVFTGNFLYPQGMAETKRVQYFIDAVKSISGYSASVLLFRQGHPGRDDSRLSGEHNGVPYVTIGADVSANWRLPWTLLKYLVSGLRFLWRQRRVDMRNVLFLYGEPSVESVIFVLFARMIGYRVIVDIVEDFYLVAPDASVITRFKAWTIGFTNRHMYWFADGVIVISKYLKQKLDCNSRGRFMVDLIPISVDLGKVSCAPNGFGRPIRVLYAGNFSEKDGVENLIEAFEMVGRKHPDLELLLTGKGMDGRMRVILKRIDDSPLKDRIHYLGYLSDHDYFSVVGQCDIPCVIRVRSEFADRGFPFKLGEYLATGRPVIASAVGDIPDFLVDRESAYLVEPGSTGAVAELLEYIVTHERESLEVGRAGRNVAVNHFDAEINGTKFVTVLQRFA